jgi:hypothetical protein
MLLNKAYYTFKFLVPRPLQIRLRRSFVQRKRASYADIWLIDFSAAKPSISVSSRIPDGRGTWSCLHSHDD